MGFIRRNSKKHGILMPDTEPLKEATIISDLIRTING